MNVTIAIIMVKACAAFANANAIVANASKLDFITAITIAECLYDKKRLSSFFVTPHIDSAMGMHY